MTEQEEFLYNSMSTDIKAEVDKVIKELSNNTIKELTLLSEISPDSVKEYLHSKGYYVYMDYSDKLTTPYSILKYMQLYDDEKYTCEKLEEYLEKNFKDNAQFTYHFVKKFKNELIFETTVGKSQLKVLYNYDLEDDSFKFFLPGQNYNFMVDFNTIKALLGGTINEISNKNLPIVNNYKDTHTILYCNGVKITIEKQ